MSDAQPHEAPTEEDLAARQITVETEPADHAIAGLIHPSTRLGDLIMDWIEAAVNRHAGDDQVLWDLTLIPLPPDGQPAYYVAMWMPGAVLGTNVHSALTVSNPAAATEDGIADMTHSMIERLRVERSQQINLSPVPGNGDHPHPH